MDKELRDKWIVALRSGKYCQGYGVLRTCNDKYCCLGVLADVINPDPKFWIRGHYSYLRKSTENEEGSYFTINRLYDGNLMTVTQEMMLLAFNDAHASFLAIADWIEANL